VDNGCDHRGATDRRRSAAQGGRVVNNSSSSPCRRLTDPSLLRPRLVSALDRRLRAAAPRRLSGLRPAQGFVVQVHHHHRTLLVIGSVLTPTDRATLPHAQSIISRCCAQRQSWTSSVFTGRQHLSTLTALCYLCYADRPLPAFSTFVHDEAQTPLVRSVVDVFYK